jgi:hypothetical protein
MDKYVYANCSSTATSSYGKVASASIWCVEDVRFAPYRSAFHACEAVSGFESIDTQFELSHNVGLNLIVIVILLEVQQLLPKHDPKKETQIAKISQILGRVLLLGLYVLVAFWAGLLMCEQQLVQALPFMRQRTTHHMWLVNVGLILLCFILAFADSVQAGLKRVADKVASHTPFHHNKYDVFLTHDWCVDSTGRQNHERVTQLNEALKAAGVRTWFDSDRMKDDIVDQMTSGIDGSRCIIVCITPAYISKVAGKGPRGVNDNCERGPRQRPACGGALATAFSRVALRARHAVPQASSSLTTRRTVWASSAWCRS